MASSKSSKGPYPFYLGGLSAMMASTCTHPIDQTKYRMQVQAQKGSMLKVLIRSAKSTGIPSLWDGASATNLRQGTYSSVRFALYDVIKRAWSGGETGPLPLWKLAACAGISGGLAGMVGNPAEIVLVRMCTDGVKPLAQQYNYSNCFEGLYRVVRDEGVSTLYRGLEFNVLRSVIMNISQLAAYEAIKARLLQARVMEDNVPLHLTAGVLAGTIATTLCAPVDVLKSRIQSAQGQGEGAMSMIRAGLKAEGPSFFMRGWTPAWLRLTPNTVLMFVFFEQLKRGVDAMRNAAEAKKTTAFSEV